MPKVDMSSAAINTRLKRVSQLRRLCLSLKAAKIIDKKPQSKTVVPVKAEPK